MVKYCSKCNSNKDYNEFYKRGKGLQPYCISCQNKQSKNYYRVNYTTRRQQLDQRNEKNYNENRILIDDLKKNPCTDCKIQYDHWIMTWDHLDSSTKEYNVSQMLYHSKETILKEIAKCELVCANCHSNRTYLRRRGLL